MNNGAKGDRSRMATSGKNRNAVLLENVPESIDIAHVSAFRTRLFTLSPARTIIAHKTITAQKIGFDSSLTNWNNIKTTRESASTKRTLSSSVGSLKCFSVPCERPYGALLSLPKQLDVIHLSHVSN